MIVTDNAELAASVRGLRQYGSTEKYRHEEIGFNSRLDALQAAILRAKLPHLDEWNRERREAARRYGELLAGEPIETPIEDENSEHVYHLYVVKARSGTERDRLQQHLERHGVSTGIHYPTPVHDQRSYRRLPYEFSTLPITERTASRILSLPMYPEISDREIQHVCDTVSRFFT